VQLGDFNLRYIYFIVLFFIGCETEEPIQIEPKDEKVADSAPKYKTYKNQVPMMNTGREKLERLSDVQDATRNILKTFDTHKPKISSTGSQE